MVGGWSAATSKAAGRPVSRTSAKPDKVNTKPTPNTPPNTLKTSSVSRTRLQSMANSAASASR